MGLIDQKGKIFGKISAARTVAEGLPKLVPNPSFPSINNSGDVIAFLVDMLKSLVGIDQLREIVVDTLAYRLDEIEVVIKVAMKLSLKELVNCGTDPSIPTYIQSTGSGITTETNKVDFFDILKTDPITPEGKLLYTDTQASPLTSSNDCNTFLYGTVQNDGIVETWKSLLNVRFDSVNFSPIPNNTLTFNSNIAFDSKTLTDFNNSYIDSIDLFDSKNLLNKIMDLLFGSLSVKLNKTTSQLKKEEEINSIINNIVNADENDVIDNTYFTFTNEEVASQENAANWRRKGIRVIEQCENKAISLDETVVGFVNANLSLSGNSAGEAKKAAISDAVSALSNNVCLLTFTN